MSDFLEQTAPVKSVSIFFDLSELYHSFQRAHKRKLCFESTLNAIMDHLDDAELAECHAYGMQLEKEASGFISCLRRLGIQTHFKKPRELGEFKIINWSVRILVDALKSPSDIIVIGGANPDFRFLPELFHGFGGELSPGKEVHFLTCNPLLVPQIPVSEAMFQE